MAERVVIITVTARGLSTARSLRGLYPGSEIRSLGKLPDTKPITGSITDTFRRAFAGGSPIIGICATGIVIRALAPLLADKREEPPVVVVGENGASVIPLLGAHRGANRM